MSKLALQLPSGHNGGIKYLLATCRTRNCIKSTKALSKLNRITPFAF
jgi:hypothetical protein